VSADAVRLAAGAAMLGTSWAIVRRDTGRVGDAEARAFAAVNGLRLPAAVWPLTWVPMQLGSIGGSLAGVVLSARVTRNRRTTLAALAGTQVAYWGAKLVKRTVARGRPAALLHGVRQREECSGLGYLSGHSAVALAFALAVTPSLRGPVRAVPYGLVAGVMFGRVYGGAHLPLDIVGGAGLGLLTGTGARMAFRPRPGPRPVR
jgi:undecaprenyl-diphosphatase